MLLARLASSLRPHSFASSALRRSSTGYNRVGVGSTSRQLSTYSLLMNTPIVTKGVGDLADKYDCFLLDQFGVLHDGANPLPGVVDALEQLQARGKVCIVLSNSSSRAASAAKKFEKLGLPPVYSAFLTSGELAWQYMRANDFKGKKCAWITWGGYAKDDYLASLEVAVADVEQADFLLLHGTHCVAAPPGQEAARCSVFSTGVIDEPMQRVLEVAARRGLPCVCANDDLLAVADGKLSHMPGLLKKEYLRLGGSVISFGKPSSTMFDAAMAAAQITLSGAAGSPLEVTQAAVAACLQPSTDAFQDGTSEGASPQEAALALQAKLRARQAKRRIVHVGDSLTHDISGAHAAGIDSLLVTSKGVHKHELVEVAAQVTHVAQMGEAGAGAVCNQGSSPASPPLLMQVCDLCDREQTPRPTYIVRNFEW